MKRCASEPPTTTAPSDCKKSKPSCDYHELRAKKLTQAKERYRCELRGCWQYAIALARKTKNQTATIGALQADLRLLRGDIETDAMWDIHDSLLGIIDKIEAFATPDQKKEAYDEVWTDLQG